jgi:hypothetical protein
MTFERKGDAERWLSLLEAEIVRGNWSSPEGGRVDLTDYAARWVKERELQPRTRELYESLLKEPHHAVSGWTVVGQDHLPGSPDVA